MNSLSKEIIDPCVDYLNKIFAPLFIIVFGSYGRAEARAESDLDIAVFCGLKLEAYNLFEASGVLAEMVHREVDLIDLSTASTVFATQIVTDGRVIFCKDQYQLDVFKIKTLKMYARLNEEYDDNPSNLDDFTKQDSIILNIQRAIEACIDLAMHVVSQKKLGIPQSSRDAFDLLYQNGIIEETNALKMKSMIGFGNLAVHDYQKLNIDILKRILECHLEDFNAFIDDIK